MPGCRSAVPAGRSLLPSRRFIVATCRSMTASRRLTVATCPAMAASRRSTAATCRSLVASCRSTVATCRSTVPSCRSMVSICHATVPIIPNVGIGANAKRPAFFTSTGGDGRRMWGGVLSLLKGPRWVWAGVPDWVDLFAHSRQHALCHETRQAPQSLSLL